MPWAQGRPFVWFEDELEEKVAAAALGSHPRQVIWVDLCEGLTGAALNQASWWLLAPEWGHLSNPKHDAALF